MNLKIPTDNEIGYTHVDTDIPPKDEVKVDRHLLFSLCAFNVVLKAAYSICPPFLPGEATRKGIDQSVVGAIFCIYSVSFAIVSPFVGILMQKYGRRNFLILGSLIMGVSNVGFVAMHYVNDQTWFII